MADTNNTTETPRYEHDCDRCEYLGSFEAQDLYYCEQQVGGPTLVARYGDDGPAYRSGMFLADFDRAIAVANERAKARGLIS